MTDRLVHVPGGGIQRNHEGEVVEGITMTDHSRGVRRFADPPFLRKTRVIDDDRERVQITCVSRARHRGDQRRVDPAGQLAADAHVALELRVHTGAQQVIEPIDGRLRGEWSLLSVVGNTPVKRLTNTVWRDCEVVAWLA